jgi:hypothetical protein
MVDHSQKDVFAVISLVSKPNLSFPLSFIIMHALFLLRLEL